MITTRRFMIALAVLAAFAVGFNTLATAEDEAPTAAPKVEKKMPAAGEKTATTEAATKTPSPMHTMMFWLVSEVMETPACPTTEVGGKAWRAWYASKEAKHAGLRDKLVADGWTADTTIAFFNKMKASCGDCDKACNCGTKSCEECKGAAGAAGDAAKTGDAKGACNGCKGGCDKAKDGKGAPGAAGDAAKTGDAKGSCNGCKGGCDKAKDAKGAPGAAGDAAKTGDAKDGCGCPSGCKDK